MGFISDILNIPAKKLALDERLRTAQENIGELNRASDLARVNANDALAQGQQDAGRARFSAGDMVNRQRVAYGASGIDAGVGTPAQVGASTMMMAELDARTAMNNAMRKAFGYQEVARRYDLAAQQTERGMYSDVYGTLLSTTGDSFNAVGDAFSFWMGGGGQQAGTMLGGSRGAGSLPTFGGGK